jgi:hypothetical protein
MIIIVVLPTPSHLDAMQGASEERTEVYSNTSKEYHSWQRRSGPRTAGAAGWAGWQGGGAEVWHAEMAD